jgi:hypothetical protein
MVYWYPHLIQRSAGRRGSQWCGLLVVLGGLALAVCHAYAETKMDANQPVSALVGGGKSGMELNEGVIGTVRDQAGNPLPEVFVQAVPVDPTAGPVPDIAIVTDAEGRYVWPLPPGRYQLSIAPATAASQTKEVVVEAGKRTSVNFLVR